MNILFPSIGSNFSQVSSYKMGKKKSIFAQQFAQRSPSDFGIKAQKPVSNQSAKEATKQMRQATKFGKFQLSSVLHSQPFASLKKFAR